MSQSGRDHGRIGQFRVGPDIGEGTFGLVKMGVHILTQEKMLEKQKIASAEDLSRVRREIKILKNLRHPNIIQLYEIIEDKDNIYLIMEYASQGELFKYIVDNTKLAEKEACRLFQQILNAMEYFHRLNIAHRDIKPENLFLDDNLNIKVGDFGLSNIFGQDTLLKTSCGSPCYAAPEMISGKPYSGVTVDIWATGVVLFAMLCGYLPFNYPEDQTTILFKEIRRGNYKVPSSVSREGKSLIKSILNIEYRTRYTVDQIKSHPWYKLHENWQYNFPGVIVGLQKLPIDNYIMQKVKAFGVDEAMITKELLDNRHNANTSLYYLILTAEKKRGYTTTHDIASVRFRPELMEVFQGSSTEIKPQTDRNRRQITSSQYGSAPSLNEESIKTTQNRLLGPREDISKLSDYTKSMRGLSTVAPREQNILRVSQPGIVIKQEIAKNAPAAKNSEFELYLSGSCDKGSVQVNETPIEIIPPVNQSQNVSSVGMSGPSNGQKFTPNIYNKIEISYITNNFSHGNSHLFPSGGSGKYSAPGRGPKNPDQSVSLNDSYAMDSSNYKELLTQGYGNGLQGSGSDKIGSPLTKPIPLAHSLNQKSENGVTLIKFQATDAQEDQNILMRTSLVKDSSFKQENQYRSLHELSISRPAEADPKLLAMTSLRPDPNRLYMPRDTTRSQILPRGSNTDSGHSQPKNPVSNIGSPQFTKRTVGSRTIICSGKLGSDKESTGKITAAKLAGLASTKKDKKPVINSDAQLKISKKISNIFQQIGINIKGNRNSNVSCKKTVNSNSNNSIDVKQSRRDSASSSVHDLLKQLKRKKSDKGSLAGVHKKSTSGLSSAKKKTISQINSKSKVSSFLNPKRSETKEVSLYQESDTSKKEELTSRNGHAYNLLYDKAKMQKKPKNASIALNSNDKIFGSVFDAGKKLYIGQSPLNLSALSRKSPADLINQVSESLKKSYRAADISVTNDQSYGLTVKIMRISFVIRIEALDGLKDLHTIAVYPKIVSCRATLAKYLNALFDQLEL